MRPSEAWLIYIISVLIVFIILTLANGGSPGRFSLQLRLFISFLVGAIIVLIIAPGIAPSGSDDRTWYSLLIVVAFLAPLLLGAWLVWTGGFTFMKNMGCQTEREMSCGADGQCQVVSETKVCGNERTTTLYSRNGSPAPISPRVIPSSAPSVVPSAAPSGVAGRRYSRPSPSY